MSNRSSTGQQRRRAAQREAEARREHERLAAEKRRRRLFVWMAGAGLVIVVASIAVIVILGSSSKSNSGTKPPTSSSSTVATTPFTPGPQVQLSASAPPWPVPADARPYIAAAGLQVLAQESLAVHYHAHVDIIVDGAGVTVPMGIGFVIQNGQEAGITSLHTHDTMGIIHIESPIDTPYTLGQVFTEWGVRLGAGQLGGLTNTAGKTLQVFVDGHAFSGDPATIVLKSHQEIALWYGAAGVTPTVPASYQFPSGD